MDSCGAEELAFAEEPYKEPATQEQKLAQPCANNGTESNPTTTGGNGSKGQGCPIEKPEEATGQRPTPQHCGNGKATTAQVRALYALTKRARYSDEDIASLLGPLNASTFQELTRESASQLIAYLQTEVAA
jgi:hypothetical protein